MAVEQDTSVVRTAAQGIAIVAILAVVGGVSLVLDQAILVPSLAAATFLQVLTPRARAARPWPIVMGQSMGLACGLIAVQALGVGLLPQFGIHHQLVATRVVAVCLAAGLTAIGQRVIRAENAAGAALAAIVALGDETATLDGALRGLAGIAIVALLGEIARKLLLATAHDDGEGTDG